MIKAAFFSQWEHCPPQTQLPEAQNFFDGVEFFVPLEEADIIFVYDNFYSNVMIEPSRQIPKIHIFEEAKDFIKFGNRYKASFLSQFDYVLAYDHTTRLHPNLIVGQTGIVWSVGTNYNSGDRPLPIPSLSFDDLKTYASQKTKLVSVVASNRTYLPGHRARLEFVAKLKDALGDQVDVFGRGINGFVDKRDVLDDYRYHIAIENSVYEHYWTEKLADPYLTLTFPIYHGCPNIADYFHHDAIRTINIYEPDQAIATIKDIIASDLAEKNREALIEARRQVLYDYNIFAVMARTAKDILAQSRPVIEIKEIRSGEHLRSLHLHQKLKIRGQNFLTKHPRLHKFYHFLKYKILLRKPLPTMDKDRMAQIVEYLSSKK